MFELLTVAIIQIELYQNRIVLVLILLYAKCDKCKERSLSHQLTANDTSKTAKIKNGDKTFATYRLNFDCCKSFIAIFYFLLFSMCHFAV